jgi:hypothetical protein
MASDRFASLSLLAFSSPPHAQEDVEWRANLQESIREIRALQSDVLHLDAEVKRLAAMPTVPLCKWPLECGGACCLPMKLPMVLLGHEGPHRCAGADECGVCNA